jgi:hypothetical protein
MKTLSRVSDADIDIDELNKADPSLETGGCTGINPYANQDPSFGMQVPRLPSYDWRSVFDGPDIGPGGLHEGQGQRAGGYQAGDGTGTLWDRAGDALRSGLGSVGSFFGFES